MQIFVYEAEYIIFFGEIPLELVMFKTINKGFPDNGLFVQYRIIKYCVFQGCFK